MAHFERTLVGDVDDFLRHLDQSIPGSSITANAEGASDQRLADARMAVRCYERYSALGGNRVSLTVSLLAVGEQIAVSAFSAGGSQAVFWKLNTWGEENFLARAADVVDAYAQQPGPSGPGAHRG